MKSVVPWIAALLVTTVIFGTIYVSVQQLDRLSANDAPARLASEVAAELIENNSITLGNLAKTNISQSLATWVVVSDASGTASAGNGYLGNGVAQLPKGILDSARAHGTDSVTWEPRPGLRFATVTVVAGKQYVTAGQSLKPSEDRVGTFTGLISFGWLLSVLIIIACWVLGRTRSS